MTSLDRRALLQRGSALGAAAALSHAGLTTAQSATPDATPMASPTAMDPDFLAAQAQVIDDLKQYAGQSIKILSAVVGGKTPEEDKLWAEEFTRLTGVNLELVHPTADYNQKLQADLGAGVQYDLIYTNKGFMDVLVDQGALTDLTEMITSSALLQNPTVIPTAEWDMLSYDGKFYSVFNKFEGSRMLIIRQDWLDKLGLETPKTQDDLLVVMKAFNEQDPNGDGSRPYGFSTTGTYDIQPFMSAQGIVAGLAVVDGKTTVPYATEAAIPAYEFLAQLYKDGLYDPDFATQDMGAVRNKFMTGKLGMLCYWDTWVGLFNSTVQTENPDSPFKAVGIAAATDVNGEVHITRGQPSVWVVPVNAPNPELSFKILEWWNTIDAIRLGSLGIKDYDYTVDANGTFALTETGQAHAMDHGVPTPYNSNWRNPIGELPGLAEAQAVTRQHAKLDVEGPDWEPTIAPILNDYIIKIILGDISAADGVAAMQDDLKAKEMID